MAPQRNNNLILKILVIGGLIATLIYFFHPETRALSLIINGQPVADPLIRLAAIPTLLFALFFTAVLMVVAFLGIGMFMFMAAFVFVMLGVLLVAPYFWPVLLIIFLVILLMSMGNTKNS